MPGRGGCSGGAPFCLRRMPLQKQTSEAGCSSLATAAECWCAWIAAITATQALLSNTESVLDKSYHEEKYPNFLAVFLAKHTDIKDMELADIVTNLPTP